MLQTFWMMFLTVGAVSAFGMAIALFRRYPQIPLYCVTVFIATVWDFPVRPALAHMAGTSIHFEDAIIMTAIATVVLNPAQFLKTVRPYQFIVILTLICVALSLVRGVAEFGMGGAINEFRSFLYPLGMVAWCLNQDWFSDDGQRMFRRWALVTGIAVTGACLVHTALYGLGTADSFVVSVTGVEMTGRPLTSDQAVMLVLLGLLMFRFWTKDQQKGAAFWGVVFIGVSVISQQRSAWLALAIGLIPIVVRLRGLALTRLFVGAFWAVLLGSIVLLSGVANELIQALLFSSQRDGTYVGRLDSWTTLIEMAISRGPGSVVFGEPFGFGYLRPEYRGTMISYAPHNWYVSVFLRLGLIGLALFACILAWALFRLIGGRDRVAAMGVFTAILVYMWNYSLSWQVGVLFAWALAMAVHSPRPEPEVKEPYKSRGQREREQRILEAVEQASRRRAKHAAPASQLDHDASSVAPSRPIGPDGLGQGRVIEHRPSTNRRS